MTEPVAGRELAPIGKARHARLALDVAIAVLLAAMVLSLLVRWPVYTLGFKLLRYQHEALFAVLCARLLFAVPWQRMAKASWREKVLLTAGGILCLAMLRQAVLFSGWNIATERTLLDQMAFGRWEAMEVRADVGDGHLLYPDPAFVERVVAEVPASTDSRILYLGDQRPFILAHQLYPRALFAPPRLQQLLIDAMGGSWQWTGIVDPLKPEESPLILPSDPKLPAIVPEWQAEVRSLIAQKKIGWVIYYDSAWPDRRFIHRIDTHAAAPVE